MMTRKEFLRSIVGIGAGAVGVAALAGCGDDGGSAIDAAPNNCTVPTTQIEGNHGHAITVSMADVDAGVAKTYDISGNGGHAHNVTVSATQFTQIKNGQTLNITSTTGSGHTHMVTVMCVS
jgi:hypothetical protein